MQEAVNTAMLTAKGEEIVKGKGRTEAQLYNYIARGGSTVVDTENKWLTAADAESIPCTKINKETAEKAIGMKLPVIKVETEKKVGEEVSYYVTPKGIVFCYPPYVYEGKSYITNTITLKSGDTEYKGTEATRVDYVIAEFKETGEKVKISNKEAAIVVGRGHTKNEEDIGVSYAEKGSPVGIIFEGYRNDGTGVEVPGGSSGETTEPVITENSVVSKLKVGDYVSYSGDGDSATTTWRVWKVNGDDVVITPELNNSSKQLTLSGVADYMDIVNNSATNTDKISLACKEWYTNSSLGITAENIRSMKIEDINWACGYTPSITTRYAYYPKGTSVSGSITYNGKTYTKTAHGNSTARFYTYDGGGVEKIDSNGYKYREPEADNPVYVSSTYYYYNPSSYNHVNDSSIKVGNILGSSYDWLASPCVGIGSSYAYVYVRDADSSYVDANGLASSIGITISPSGGVRPLVSLSSTLQAVGGEGTSGSPWQLSK